MSVATLTASSKWTAVLTDTTLKATWLVLSSALSLFLLVGWMRVRLAARHWETTAVDGVRVRVSSNVGPAVVGFFRPEIVVPRWLLARSEPERKAALAHERAHIAAHDTQIWLLALFIVVAMPWNVPLWWQLRRLRFAIEVDCDWRVLANGTSIETYGEMLLAVTQQFSRPPVAAIAMSGSASQLERRIRIMTNDVRGHAAVAIVALMALSTSLVAVAAQLDAPSFNIVAPVPVRLSPTKDIAASTVEPISPVRPAIPISELKQSPVTRTNAKSVPVRVVQVSAPKVTDTPPIAPVAPVAPVTLTANVPTSSTGNESQTPTDRPLRIVNFVAPKLPDNVPRQGDARWVEISYTVVATGELQNPAIINSYPDNLTDEAALAALRQWRFAPAIKDGKPVSTQTRIRIRFY